MTFSRKRIAIAVGSVMGLGLAGSAQAAAGAVDLSASPIVPIKFASEIASTVQSFGGPYHINWTSLSNYPVTPANPFYIKLALKSGAKFKAAPAVFCTAKQLTGTATVQVMTALTLTNGGGAGSTSATFQLGSGYTLTGGKCFVSAKSATISSHVDQSISAVQEYKNGLNNVSDSKVGVFVTFANKGMTAKVTVGTTAVQLNVSDASKTFVVGKNLTTGMVTLGSLVYSANAGILNQSAAAFSAKLLVKTATITVSGAAIAGMKTDFPGSAIILVSGNAACTAAGTNFVAAVTSSGTNSVTFKQAAGVSGLSAGITICGRAKTTGGATKIDGPVYVTFSATGKTGYSPSTGISGASLKTITKNGSTRRVFNLPAPGNTADAAYVRITNASTIAGKMYVTLTAEDGTTIGTASSLLNGGTAVAAGATLVLSSTDLKTAVGAAADWTGRARATITGEVDSMEVMGLIRNAASGNLNNMSPVAPQ